MPYSNRIPINLQSVIDAADNGFVVIDKNYNIIAANTAYCDAYGVSRFTMLSPSALPIRK